MTLIEKKIHISVMKDTYIETLRANHKLVSIKLFENPKSNLWLTEYLGGNPYIEKQYTINDFSLQFDEDYSKVRAVNAITLHQNLKELPRYILANEGFWLWLYFEKFYEISLVAMPISSGKNIFKYHWLFEGGNRRGIFFGVLSRDYFTVELTFDSTAENPYHITEFALQKYERFRNLTWRSYSSNKTVVKGVLKAEMRAFDKYSEIHNIDKAEYYTRIGKFVSKLGGIKLLDSLSEEKVEKLVFEVIDAMINKELENESERNHET